MRFSVAMCGRLRRRTEMSAWISQCARFLLGAWPLFVFAWVFWSLTASQAATLTSVYAFTGGADGQAPTTGLVVGPKGLLYGATASTIYQLQDVSGVWTVTPIYTNASQQAASLVGTSAHLYASFPNGDGTTCAASNLGCILELTPPTAAGDPWTWTTIHNFAGGADGSAPAGLTIAPSGAVVGVTAWGGGSANCPIGCGTVFSLTNSGGVWNEKIVLAFNLMDGRLPQAAPTFDATGRIFLATNTGGIPGSDAPTISCDGVGVGLSIVKSVFGSRLLYVLWKGACNEINNGLAYSDSQFEPLLDFALNSAPSSGVALRATASSSSTTATSSNGALFTTEAGGNANGQCDGTLTGLVGCGAVVMLKAPTGATPLQPPTLPGPALWLPSIVHEFSFSDGAAPRGAFLAYNATTLYGVAALGGSTSDFCTNLSGFGCGVIYKLTLGSSGWVWAGATYIFSSAATGALPAAQLTLYQGQIMGVTSAGGSTAAACGASGCGTIFSLTP